MARPIIPLLDRIVTYIQIEPQSGCWLWIGAVSRYGYGIVDVGGKTLRAHRVTYEFFIKPIPEGMIIDHLCRTKRCVNPEHCEPVTIQENLRRHWAAMNITHCPQGHEYTKENTKIHNGMHSCIECNRTRAREYQRRKAAERLGHHPACSL